MPRIASIKRSVDGVHHIIERGKKDIFNDDIDRI